MASKLADELQETFYLKIFYFYWVEKGAVVADLEFTNVFKLDLLAMQLLLSILRCV